MGLTVLQGIILYVASCTFIVYFLVINDSSTSQVSRCLTVTLPSYIGSILGKIIGREAVQKAQGATKYALLVLYLVIVLGSWSVMFTYGYSFISKSNHVSNYHKYSGYVVFVACMYSWRLTNTTSPGYITASNITRFDNYPYDDLLFVEHSICPTVGIRKLPRSKYDRVSKRHVARFDHYCGWVQNTIGEENYRFFLSFLLVHVGMCAYGAIVTFMLFYGEIQDKDLMNAIFFNGTTGAEVEADFFVIVHYLLMRHFQLAAVLLLMSVMTLVLLGFLGFHLYMASKGMTTNEFYKWKQVGVWYRKEKRRYEEALKEGKIGNKNKSSNGDVKEIVDADVDMGCVGPMHNTPNQNKAKEEQPNDDNVTKVFNPGPPPVNIYNRGIIENFKEIIFPRSLRMDALIRQANTQRKIR